MAAMSKASEKTEGPGPDNDGDADDKAPVKSATAPGVGSVVDMSA